MPARPLTAATLLLWAPYEVECQAELLREDQWPLATWERYIVDNRNDRVKWACVNWAGAYMDEHAVLGLNRRHIDDIARRIVELGFNCVRLPYSTQGVIMNPVVSDAHVAKNPQLQGGRRMLDLFDAAVEALTKRRLMVIINNHNSKSGWCCAYDSEEGLWYTPGFNESIWLQGLVTLAIRYKGNKFVVAFDIRNEPHDYGGVGLTWGNGDEKHDWALAAKRAGDAILKVHPFYLIVVEALCLAKELRPLQKHQVNLAIDNRVVYEVHAYHYFQMYSMWSDMFMSWKATRNLALSLAVLPLALLILLHVAWIFVGRIWPPPGILATSVGAWIFIAGMAFMLFHTAVYFSMTTTACSITAIDEQRPAMLTGAVAALSGAVLLYVGHRTRLGLRCLTGWARTLRNKPGKGGTAGSEEELTEFAVLFSDTEDGSDEDKDCCCCRPGCMSVGLAYKGLLTGTAQRASWDCGLCCGLQCCILALLLLLAIVGVCWFSWVATRYWWFKRHHDIMWGFALDGGHAWTAPVWVGEFGTSGARGNYWLLLMRYMSERDVDWAYWVLNPEKPLTERYVVGRGWVRYQHPAWVNETWGILETDWETVRYPWKMMDLRRVMPSPAHWSPEEYPCNRDIYGSECGG